MNAGSRVGYLKMSRNRNARSILIQSTARRSHLSARGDRSISLTISASIGVAVQQKDGRTADALIKSADVAMYRAKQGESRYAFA